MIRLLVAEDHAVVRAGLQQLFATASDIELVAEASDGVEAVVLAAQLRPDVILMDLSMPNLDGRRATEQILAVAPETRVVILTSFSDRGQILAALDAGAVGYLLKDTDPGELIEGVRAAGRGQAPLAPKAAHALVTDRHSRRPAEELSSREREVLILLADGLPNKMIARHLGISEKTVKTHVTRVFRILGVTDRTQAALWAREHDLRAE
ncbi:MAG: response regulator transcription factor [Actinomycetota bacterium]|nr:response regulator transcription factor [Actinomycetota bacterium]